MNEILNICRLNLDGTLTILDSATLPTVLDTTKLIVLARYKREQYEVQGTFAFPYIVIEKEGEQ